jgi:prepilin-type N-terminal cleavage/methylation domain-containing protein
MIRSSRAASADRRVRHCGPAHVSPELETVRNDGPYGKRRRAGFTLMELLVVVAIVVIVSAAALPVIRPALSQRKVSSAALIVQGELARCRDEAIRANAPRGIRLLPSLDDQFKFVPYPAGGSPTAAQLQAYSQSTPAYTRMVSIEPSPDYSSGLVSVKPVGFVDNPAMPETDSQGNPLMAYLRVQECLYFYVPGAPTTPLPNERTNWYWNVRVGDTFQFDPTGTTYTIVGPVGVSDPTKNPELFVNNDTTNPGDYGGGIQFLYLVNGQDDPAGNGDGYIDNSFDNIDNNYDGSIDPSPGYSIWPGWPGPDTTGTYLLTESEHERFLDLNLDPAPFPNSDVAIPGNGIDEDGDGNDNPTDPYDPLPPLPARTPRLTQKSYIIHRRPIPSPGSRIQELPTGTSIDMTGWNRTTPPQPQLGERSRLPIDPRTGYIDILIAPNGMVLKADYNTTQPGPPMSFPFFHFWISDNDDIVTPLWGVTYPATALPTPDVRDSQGRLLKGERRLVSINTRTGQIVTGSAENFSTSNINTPFFNVEHGIRDEQ